MKATTTYAAIAALSAGAKAMHLRDPAVTKAVKLPDDGVSPVPTQAPQHELFRRAGTMLYAPDNTCGYISALAGAGYTCYSTATCAFSKSGSEGHVACCDDDGCNMRYNCIDYNDYYSSSACGDGCQIDINTLKCTDTTASYCNTISFSGGVTDYWCNSRSYNGVQTAYTTYSGGDDRVYSTLEDATTASIITSGTAVQPTVTVHASATTSAASSDGGSSTPIGAIVGGVVGGVGGLALIGAIVFLFMRNKNKKKDAAAAAAAAAATNNNNPPYQPPPMQQQPGVGPGGYNPVPQTNAGYYDPKNPYPSPGQQYNQPISPAGYYQPGSPDPNQVDPRLAAANTSPSPSYNQQTISSQHGFQPQQGIIHEAPANAPGTTGRGETHELA